MIHPAALDDDTERRLRRTLATAFARRRQTLRNNLRAALGDDAADALLAATGVDGTLRAETLSAEAFRALAAAWPGDGTD